MFVQFIPILIDNLVPELMSELLASQMHSYTLNRGNKYESVIYLIHCSSDLFTLEWRRKFSME